MLSKLKPDKIILLENQQLKQTSSNGIILLAKRIDLILVIMYLYILFRPKKSKDCATLPTSFPLVSQARER